MISNNIIESKWPKIDIPLVTISRFLIEKLRFYGNKTFIIENESKNIYTFNEVANDSLRMAQVLSSNGLKEDQNFGICGYNNYEFITTLFGGLIVGGVAVPINGNTSLEMIKKVIQEKHIKCMTITTRHQKSISEEAIKKFNKALKTIVSFNTENNKLSNDYQNNSQIINNEYKSYRRHISSHKCANESHIGVIKSVNNKIKNCLIVETNGSFDASKSKSCLITDYNLLSQTTMSSLPVTGFNWSSSDTVLNTTSFTHINGITQLFASLASGSQFVIFENHLHTNCFDLSKTIEEWSVSAAMFTPQIIIEMIKEDMNGDMKSLKKVICTGASMPKNIGNKFIDKYRIQDFRQAYGMTEMCGFATIESIGSQDFETSGVPLPSVQIKIVDTDTHTILSATQVGEVYIKSPQLFKGYLTIDSNQSSKDLIESIDSDGWFHTNDIGYYDLNNKLQIVDPTGDFIQYRGLHISPTSLEAILLSHFAVKEVAIFGSYNKSDGQTPTALVVLKSIHQYINNDNVTEILKKYINDHLIHQKIRVEELYIVDEIPKTISGKINRTDLRKFVNETIGEINNN